MMMIITANDEVYFVNNDALVGFLLMRQRGWMRKCNEVRLRNSIACSCHLDASEWKNKWQRTWRSGADATHCMARIDARGSMCVWVDWFIVLGGWWKNAIGQAGFLATKESSADRNQKTRQKCWRQISIRRILRSGKHLADEHKR